MPDPWMPDTVQQWGPPGGSRRGLVPSGRCRGFGDLTRAARRGALGPSRRTTHCLLAGLLWPRLSGKIPLLRCGI